MLRRWLRQQYRALPFLLLVPLIAGCAGALSWQPDVHTVRRGETLYSIAWQYGLDWRRLARWNDLPDPRRIYPGERLRLTPPGRHTGGRGVPSSDASRPSPAVGVGHPTEGRKTPPARPRRTTAAGSIHWQWPVRGKIIEGFDLGRGGRNKGIDIGGYVGEPIRAAAAGKVVYSGSGLIGYGKLIIIKHTSDVLSAYAYNRTLYVQEGDRVNAGQTIAEMGTGTDNRPMLHFEIRVDGDPVNPARLLPGS